MYSAVQCCVHIEGLHRVGGVLVIEHKPATVMCCDLNVPGEPGMCGDIDQSLTPDTTPTYIDHGDLHGVFQRLYCGVGI